MPNSINEHIVNNTLKIIVKPNSPKNEVIGWDKDRRALRVSIAAAPDKDKANKEVIKFFSKLLKKKVAIKMGARSREKVLKIT